MNKQVCLNAAFLLTRIEVNSQDEAKSAVINVPGTEFSKIDDQNCSVFRVDAPDAPKVRVLKEAGINNTYYQSEGTAHEWQTWRRCLYQVAPLLFNE